MDRQYKVLLVEDNPGDARLVCEFLARAGSDSFQVTCADCLSKAEGYLGEEHFDVVLLDMALPDGKGTDLIARILARARHLPVVVLTGTYPDEMTAHEALRQGAQDYLIKGKIDSEGLARAIRYAIERKHFEEALAVAKKSLEGKVAELEVLNRAMMNREERILELKEQLRKLQQQTATGS